MRHTAIVAAAEQRTSNARISGVIAGVTLAVTGAIVVVVPRVAVSLTSPEPVATAVGPDVFAGPNGFVGAPRRVPPGVTIVGPGVAVGGAPGVQLPPPGPEQPADPDAARSEVEQALLTLFSGKNPREVRLTGVDDRSNVDSAMDAVRKQYPEASDTTEPEMAELVFTDPSNASFLFRLRYTGAPLLPSRVGTARLVDGRWLVTRSTLCEVMSAAGHPCEPPAATPTTLASS